MRRNGFTFFRRKKANSLLKSLNSGFTLIELIVVVGITGILSVILTDTLIQTLRGENKVKVLNRVKQNGQVVLGKLSSEIRQAEKVVCLGYRGGDPDTSDEGDTIVVFRQGNYYRFRLNTPEETLPLKNGSITQESFTAEGLVDPVTDIIIETSELCTEGNITRGIETTLSDTDLVNGVSLDLDSPRPVFEDISSNDTKNIISIRFKAAQGMGTGQSYESSAQEGGVLFATTVQVRGGK